MCGRLIIGWKIRSYAFLHAAPCFLLPLCPICSIFFIRLRIFFNCESTMQAFIRTKIFKTVIYAITFIHFLSASIANSNIFFHCFCSFNVPREHLILLCSELSQNTHHLPLEPKPLFPLFVSSSSSTISNVPTSTSGRITNCVILSPASTV